MPNTNEKIEKLYFHVISPPENDSFRKDFCFAVVFSSFSVSYSFDSDSSCVRRNKSGEDRSSNPGDLDVSLYPPKAHFSEEHISAHRGCCAPKFLHALENDQVLLAHPQPGTGPPYNFFQRVVKNWLKM